jgi:hypothetical protein
MPGEPYPRSLIHRLVESGNTSSGTLREFREAGGKIRTQTWYRLWGEVENERSLSGIETGKPLHLKPVGEDILQMTTRRARGFMQRVQVIGRTIQGDVVTKTIDIRSPDLVSRKNAIGKAMGIVEGIESDTGRETGSVPVAVITGFYGGTFQLNPE